MGRPIVGIPILLAPDAFDVPLAVDIQILIKHADACLQRSKKLMKLFKRALKKLATLHTVSGVWSEKARP